MSPQSILTHNNWQNSEGRYWTTLFNTISGPRTAVMIGTHNGKGLGNIGLFNSLVHIGAKPPLLGFILRPTTVPRHTYENLKETGDYTINLISQSRLDSAHQSSAKYEVDIDEFEALGIEKEIIPNVNAPFIKSSPIKLGLSFVEEHLIERNGTRLIVGEVKTVLLSKDLIDDDGYVNTSKAETVLASGLYTYHSHQLFARKPYAKP